MVRAGHLFFEIEQGLTPHSIPAPKNVTTNQRWAPAHFSCFHARKREAKKERESAKKKEREKKRKRRARKKKSANLLHTRETTKNRAEETSPEPDYMGCASNRPLIY